MLRSEADGNKKSIVATLYQAGNALFDHFDKVLVLCDGRPIYYGPRGYAKQYFEDMGFVCPRGANVADFLTSVSVSTERTIRPGFEAQVPHTAQEFEQRFKDSLVGKEMVQTAKDPDALLDETRNFKDAVYNEKSQSLFLKNRDLFTVSLWDQVLSCTIRYLKKRNGLVSKFLSVTVANFSISRQFQILWGDKFSLVVKVVSSVVQALVVGSLFYNLSHTSDSIFTRPGAVFFPIFYFLLQALSETTAAFLGRPILSRHKRFGFYRPTAFCIAKVITDIPEVLAQVTCFTLILYWMCSLQADAGKFFTHWIVVAVNFLCYISLFRMIGAGFRRFGDASKISGFLCVVYVIYGGKSLNGPNTSQS